MSRFLIISDPHEKLLPKSDTGFSMLREALRRGHEVFWACSGDLKYQNSSKDSGLAVSAERVISCAANSLPSVEPNRELLPLSNFNGVWIRKEPPFDGSYLSMCWLLALEEKAVQIVNAPSVLMRYHEKLIPFDAVRAGFLKADEVVPSFFSLGDVSVKNISFLKSNSACITKPLLGHGGVGVKKWDSLDEIGTLPKDTVLQPFIPEILKTGDRRVFFLNGKQVGDFVRMPEKGSIMSNLSRGGTAHMKKFSPKEMDLMARVGQFLKSVGIVLAGIDVMNEKLSEVNITSPTGFETLKELGGADLGSLYLDLMEAKG